MTTRVLCSATVAPEHQNAFEDALRDATKRISTVPGYLSNDLLLSAEDGTSYIWIATWESDGAFRAWLADPSHLEFAAPLRPYWADTFRTHVYRTRDTE